MKIIIKKYDVITFVQMLECQFCKRRVSFWFLGQHACENCSVSHRVLRQLHCQVRGYNHSENTQLKGIERNLTEFFI